MARRKNQTWLDRIADISIISLLFNPVTLMIFVSIFATLLWNKYNSRLDLHVNSMITRDVLHLSEPPEWIKTDISKIAIQESRLSEIKLSEPSAVELVAASLAVQPWVKSVRQVQKTATGIFVDLQYRRPMAFVEIGQQQLVPVDDEGVVLDPRDFMDNHLVDYWRVYLPEPITNGLATGRRWDDIRVTDSVLIGNAWDGTHVDAGLMHIVNRSQRTRDRVRLSYYELWTRGKSGAATIVIWGNPPGYEVNGEASATEKIAGIKQFIRDYGPLDAQQNRHYDVRTGKVVESKAKLAADGLDFINLRY